MINKLGKINQVNVLPKVVRVANGNTVIFGIAEYNLNISLTLILKSFNGNDFLVFYFKNIISNLNSVILGNSE